ncbi:MAG: 50S ribosomal protein L3 [Oscillatoriales cyanobacterium SM2_2_1]|nr:50S ribosomal protein L3 [Oscillatoriales cyanobacterium SM2_2_1]
MSVGILGKKVGMTQVFDQKGNAVPVTIIQAGPCRVTQIKTLSKEGYSAIQLGFGAVGTATRSVNTKTSEGGASRRVNKYLSMGQQGHLRKSGAELVRHLREYRVADVSAYQLGQEINVTQFQEGDRVDVVSTSIGRGFAGNQKRNNFGRGPMAHGSKNHRAPGSIGAGTTPGRVFPGVRMAGRLGGKRTTAKKLTLFKIDSANHLLLVKGTIPGKPGTLVSVIPAKIVGK